MPKSIHHAVLLSVPIFWGTFAPVMKLLLDHHRPPPILLLNLVSHVVGLMALCLLWTMEAVWRRRCFPAHDTLKDEAAYRYTALASFELGVYLFLGQLAQLAGLRGTSATTNAILVQSSVVVIPIIDEYRSRLPSHGRTHRLMPSLVALAGVVILSGAPPFMNVKPQEMHDPAVIVESREASHDYTMGVFFSLVSASCYAAHTLRISDYDDMDVTVQATGQLTVNALLDVLAVWVVTFFWGAHNGPLHWLRRSHGAGDHAALDLVAASVWNGVFVVGATTWAMSYAQRVFCAPTAALVYAMEPLFAALFASVLLQEHVGMLQIAGGALIVAANVLAGGRTNPHQCACSRTTLGSSLG